jgi:AbrB family looped-hinge helix DNA binding protein
MSKVTSKLQVTIPKAIAIEYDIEPGDEIEFQPAGDTIRIVPPRRRNRPRLTLEERLRLFDEDTKYAEARARELKLPAEEPPDRGWTREDLYSRGKPR